MYAVKYEARLADGTVVSKSDVEVAFVVQDGMSCGKEGPCGFWLDFQIGTLFIHSSSSVCYFPHWALTALRVSCAGHFCPALSKAVKTMKKGEKVLLSVKPQCTSRTRSWRCGAV